MKRELIIVVILSFCLGLLLAAAYVESELLAYYLVGFAIGSAAWAVVWRVYAAYRNTKPVECGHTNLFEKRWVNKDGRPMVRQWCPDCNFHIHVHASWLDE